VPTERPSRWVRILGVVVGGIYLVFGVGELLAHLDQPVSLAFWAPSLLGGGALVLYGVFGRPSRYSTKLVVAGSLLGLVATAWTLIVPVLAIVLVVLTFNSAHRNPVAP
jgi:uncharacterized membrane protein HdeD (DUF308 family)